jgi:vacuolar protein sorting-associated protein 26
MASYLWGAPVDVEIRLENEDARRKAEVKLEKDRRDSLPVYLDGESVIGQVRIPTTKQDMGNAVLTGFPSIKVTVRLRDGRKLAHDGIKIEFIGSIGTNGLLIHSAVLLITLPVMCRTLLRPRKPL